MMRYAASLVILLSIGAIVLAQADHPPAQPDPWQQSDLIQPATLAARLKGSGEKPLLLYVGFPVLYRSTRIPGAILAGPVRKPEGLQLLKRAVANSPKDREIVLYCGCCPWMQCPNVRPAFKTLREMGFTNLKLVMMPTNLSTDWVSKGYPVEKAASTPGS
jgi:rhodanese-related sulfurtransferase